MSENQLGLFAAPAPAPKERMALRPYQQEAFEKIMWAMENLPDGNDLVILPTGAGKSIVIAHVAHALNMPILILQPTKEILEQNYAKLLKYVGASEIGIFSASMNERTIRTYTFATIQSIYQRAELFSHFKLVIIDEAHLVNPKNLGGMFTSFLKKIGMPKVIGLTATPYRMDNMYIGYGTEQVRVVATIKLINRMKGFFWQRILFNTDIAALIEAGYLCPLEYVDMSVVKHEEIPLNKSQSEFDMEKYENVLESRKQKIRDAIQHGMDTSKSVLVFCSSVHQATKLGEEWNAPAVSAKTSAKERDRIIKGFKDGSIKLVFNVGVLTTGFDHPALDCIVLLRPTRSIGLYYQMLGRGVRIAPGKTACKVIDLTSTVKSMGRVETIKLIKREKWELESEAGSWHARELYSYLYTKGGGSTAPKTNTSLHDAIRAVES